LVRLMNAMSMITFSCAGFMTPTVLLSWAAHHWPSMYIFLSVVAVAGAVAVAMSLLLVNRLRRSIRKASWSCYAASGSSCSFQAGRRHGMQPCLGTVHLQPVLV